MYQASIRRMRVLCVSILVMNIFAVGTLLANTTIRGQIIDEKTNQPIEDATISVVSSEVKETSDKQGHFSLQTAKEGNVELTIEREGYRTEKVVVKDHNAPLLLSLMSEEPLSGENKKRILATEDAATSGISTLSAENLERLPGESVLASLQGRVAGLSITEDEEHGTSIRLRGDNSINANHPPLFIVNGVPFPAKVVTSQGRSVTPLVGIKSADIDKIEILKDADATTLYGARGANGVILITTKQSQEGRIKVTADASVGFSRILKRFDLLNTSEYLEMRQKAMNMDGVTPTEGNAYDLLFWGNQYETDWQKELLGNTAKVYNAQVGVGGGTEQTSFSAGVGFYQTGIVIFDQNDDKFSRFNARLSVNHQSADKRFEFNSSILYSTIKKNNTGLSPMRYVLGAPNQPLYNDDGSVYWLRGNSNFDTPLSIKSINNEDNVNTFLGNISLGYSFLEGLQGRVDLGYTKNFSDEFASYGNGFFNPDAASTVFINRAVYGNAFSEVLSVEPQLNYTRVLGEGRLTALLGATWQSMNNKKSAYIMNNFPSESLFKDPASAAVKSSVESASNQYKYASLFGRLTYDWGNRYVVNGVLRRDGSSRFSQGHRFGTFWSIGAAWIFTRESFINIPFLSYGKLRGSYGSTGNDQVGDFLFLETYQPTTFAYGGMTGLYQELLADKKFKWEVTKKAELALELGFFDERLSITTSFFDNRSDNLVVPFPVASQSGFTSLRTNMPGVLIQNKGVEVELSSTNIKTSKFYWTSSFNISFLDNRLLTYPDLENSPYATTYKLGHSINMKRGYEYIGIDRETGVAQVRDVNNDGKITSIEDQVFLDKTDVRFYGGLFNTLKYGNFQLDFTLVFVRQPFKAGWFANYARPLGMIQQNTRRDIYKNSWTPENKDAKYPALTTSTSTPAGQAYWFNYTMSDQAYSDASFIRLQNLGLTYTLPRGIVRKMSMSQCRLFVKTQNVLTLTRFDSWDPQTGTGVPPSFSLLLGAKVAF